MCGLCARPAMSSADRSSQGVQNTNLSLETPPSRRRLLLALAVAVLAISFAAVLFKLAPDLDPAVAAGYRLVIAGLITLPLTLRARIRPSTLALAGLAYGVHFGTWVASLGLVPVALSVTAVTTTPLLLALIGFATGRDRPDLRILTSLLVAISGLALMTLGADTSGDVVLGLTLALLGAAAMAAYLLVVRRMMTAVPLNPLALSGGAALLGGLMLLGVGALYGARLLPSTAEETFAVLGAATLPQLVGHGLMTWATRYLSPTEVALATLGEPMGAALLAALLLGEGLDVITVLGGVMTLLAVTLALTRRR